jgi:hypothetical protein
MPKPGTTGGQVGITIYRCSYSEEDFRNRATSILLEVAQTFAKYARRFPGKEEALKAIFVGAMTICYRRMAAESPRMKHQSFGEEKEWRIVALPSPSSTDQVADFRTRNGCLVPFLKLPMGFRQEGGRLRLGRVVVGPGEDPARAELAARMLLSRHGYDASMVTQSQIPFRSR